MILHCWRHKGPHRFTTGEVERIVYAMAAELMTPVDDELAYTEANPPCPQEALDLARSTEGAIEHVEQGVECRRAATR